jgi:hypothetical protein
MIRFSFLLRIQRMRFSEGTAMLDYEHGPVAVMLDFMNPVSALGRLVGEAWELWLDKAETGSAGHACYLAGLPRIASQRST